MASKVYQSDVYAADGCCGEYVEVTRRDGRVVARTVRLYTHGPDQVGRWGPATDYDVERARAPLAWLDEAERGGHVIRR